MKFLLFTLLVTVFFRVDGQTFFSLQSAVSTAKLNNPSLKAESYNVNLAQGNVTTAKLHTNPVLNNQTLQLVDSKFYAKGTEASNPLNRQVWWQLTKPFVPVKQRHNRIEMASQNVFLTQKAFAESVRAFSSSVALQWVDAWILKSKRELLNEAYSNIDSLVKINRARLRNQVITQTDLMRTQLLQEQYRLQIINSEKEFKNQIQTLKFLLGVNDSIDVDMDAALEPVQLSDNLDTLLSVALRERSDVGAAEVAVKFAESNIKYQKSLVLPQPELGMIWNPQNTQPYVGFFGTIRLPLFDRNQGEIEKSKFFQLQAQEGLRNISLRLITEVKAAHQAYQTDKENLLKYEIMLTQADQVLENVRYAYLKGGTTIIDFLDAQRSWFDTRQLLLNARQSYFQSYIHLLYVTGLINQL